MGINPGGRPADAVPVGATRRQRCARAATVLLVTAGAAACTPRGAHPSAGRSSPAKRIGLPRLTLTGAPLVRPFTGSVDTQARAPRPPAHRRLELAAVCVGGGRITVTGFGLGVVAACDASPVAVQGEPGGSGTLRIRGVRPGGRFRVGVGVLPPNGASAAAAGPEGP